jgi:hypothetical protein
MLASTTKIRCSKRRKESASHWFTPPQMADDVSLTRLIIAVHLSRVGTQQLLLKLDSGTNGPILYDPGRHLAAGLFVTTSVRAHSADGTERIFGVLPSQVGGLSIPYQMELATTCGGPGCPSNISVDNTSSTFLPRGTFSSVSQDFRS